MRDLRKLVTVLNFRFQTYGRCMQVMKRSVALCSDLKAFSEESLQKFLVHLKNCGKFMIEYEDEDVVEFLSTSLQDPERRRIFDEAISDFSFALTDDFRIRVYQGGTRHGDIYVESRHSWVKDKWVSEVSHSFGLQITNSGYSPMPKLNLWMMNVRSRLEMISLSSFWVTNILEDGGFLTVDPATNIMMHYLACVHSAEILINPISLLVASTGMLWTVTMAKMGSWLCTMEKLIGTEWLTQPWKKLTFCMNLISQLIRRCPKSMRLHGLVNAMTDIVNLLQDDADLKTIDKENKDINEKMILKEMTVKCIDEAVHLESKKVETCGPAEVKYLYRLGGGSFGQVYRCYDPVLNCAIALKVVTVPAADAVSGQHLASEIGHLKYINHRNITRLHDYVVQGNTTYLKMELCDGGSLQDLIKPGNHVDLRLFRGVAHQILLGLSFLHANQIVHGDMKPANILCDSFGAIKLADFGTSHCLINSARNETTGTFLYTAPEVLVGGAALPHSDLWSVGCTLFHLATGIPPWADCRTSWQVMLKASQKQCFDLTPLHQCPLPQEAKDIILACLEVEPASRPYVPELLVTKYFFDPE
ncbi:hypothetical protein PSACC_00594 [Paramicrosporidium saccamoebae]|uniref:Protein kinase domain-containing protein n=1 Tax=Paramicrosporidium saccamoebae TaxID=1246581 RepID=A0A2H9TPB9_9FUNG|nr:hypothetical protein PSACC_00594 [Paramicrosporidium saccamoebae]